MGREWLWQVLQAWGLPERAFAVADILVCGRAVQARVEDYAGLARALRRSIGMGGLASTLLWNVG
eukprot:3659961-Lingulodinium_polyedra.AAC.1